MIGCGPVGLMAILGARVLEAEKIFAIDREPSRLEMAKQFGAVPIQAGPDTINIIKENTQGRGVDGVLEAVGSSGSISLGYDLLRHGGIGTLTLCHRCAKCLKVELCNYFQSRFRRERWAQKIHI